MYNKFYFARIQASWVWAAWKRDSSEALSGGWLLVTSRTRQWSPWKFNQSWKGRLTIFFSSPSCATCGTFCTCMWLQARHQMWLERDFMSGEKCPGGDFLLLVVVSNVKCCSGGLVCCFNGVRDRIYAGLFRLILSRFERKFKSSQTKIWLIFL